MKNIQGRKKIWSEEDRKILGNLSNNPRSPNLTHEVISLKEYHGFNHDVELFRYLVHQEYREKIERLSKIEEVVKL